MSTHRSVRCAGLRKLKRGFGSNYFRKFNIYVNRTSFRRNLLCQYIIYMYSSFIIQEDQFLSNMLREMDCRIEAVGG